MILRILAAAAFLAGASPALAEAPRSESIRYEVPGAVPLLQPSVTAGPVVEVLMTDDRLSPRRAVVRPGETIRWQSVAREASAIVFEREVARSMICHSLVNFELEGDTLRSAPLQTGDTSSFCRLSPGTYRYRVERNGPSERPTAGGRQLSTRLEGMIVVLPKAESIAAR
ncbi:MAG: hypothetical protein HKP30_08530 [Myxococcales bacterium]|nr:hypothetical protein [Myxococcales bacterium]